MKSNMSAVTVATCCLILWASISCCEGASDILVFTQILFRHGDRAPYYSYPKNPVPPTFWTQGFQQLTQVGMQQQYKLGRYLRQRYIEGHPYRLLNDSYQHDEIYVRSTDVDRTLMSAYSNLAGLYPPAGMQVWSPDIKWQPIPVHTIPDAKDHLLNMEVTCPKYDEIYEAVLNSELVRKEELTNKAFYEYLKNETGLKDENITLIWELYDTLICQRSHNISLPDWASREWEGETAFNKMGTLYGLLFSLQLNQNDEQRRLRGGSLLKEIIEMMRVKISGTISPIDRKIMMYSAHDDTIAGLLSAMDVYNSIAPPYASTVIIDLIQVETGAYIVQLFYRNDSTHDPYPLIIPGCSGNCTFDKFVDLTRNVIPENWTNECNFKYDAGLDVVLCLFVLAFTFFCLFVTLLLILIAEKVRQARKQRNEEYEKILNM